MKKQYSLKSNIKFNKVLNNGKKISNKYLLISYRDSKNFELGISIPKKLGNAVFRNYQKRSIKSIIPSLNIYDKLKKEVVVIVRNKFTTLSLEQKTNVLNEVFKKIK